MRRNWRCKRHASRNLYRLRREVTLSNQVKSVTVRSHNVEDADKPFESKAVSVTGVGGGSNHQKSVQCLPRQRRAARKHAENRHNPRWNL